MLVILRLLIACAVLVFYLPVISGVALARGGCRSLVAVTVRVGPKVAQPCL